MRANETLRNVAKTFRIPLWKVASTIGVSEPTLTRWLRFPLSHDREEKIISAITVLSANQQINNSEVDKNA